MRKVIGIFAFIVFFGIFLLSLVSPQASSEPTASAGKDYPAELFDSRNVPPPPPQKIIQISARELRQAYEKNNQEADSRYKGHEVEVTGNLTGIFVPSKEESERMARKDQEVDDVVMMDSPPVPQSNPGEGMFYPGIVAHSKNGSFFGVNPRDVNEESLNGMVTLSCTVGDSYHISDITGEPRSMWGDVNISLYDCILQGQPSAHASDVLP